MSLSVPPSRATIDQHLNAVYPSFAMLAGVRVGAFTPLGNGPMDATELAEVLGVNPFKLETLLYGLVMANLLTLEGGRFAITPEADFYLVEGRTGYVGHKIAYYADRWTADLRTAESLLTDTPQGELDYASMSEAQLNEFYKSWHAAALATGRQLADMCDFRSFGTLLEIAGGSGGLTIAACQHCPDLQATIVDLPTATPVTRRYVDEAGLADRITIASHDVTHSPPEGHYDAAVMMNFIQILTRDDARRALVNIGKALVPGGKVFIIGYVLDDSQISPPDIAASNFAFLNLYDEGRAYTESLHCAWLEEAGFSTLDRTLLPGGLSLIRSKKAV